MPTPTEIVLNALTISEIKNNGGIYYAILKSILKS
jgi:hypothetical protein